MSAMLALAFLPPDSCVSRIAEALAVPATAVAAVARELADGHPVPFIARYRRDATAGLDAETIIRIRDKLEETTRLHDRREAIVRSLKRRGGWSPELDADLRSAATPTELDDLCARFAPKRRSRGNAARSRGLEPLADFLLANQNEGGVDPIAHALRFVRPEAPSGRGAEDEAAALAGARAILAERIAEDPDVRLQMRDILTEGALFTSRLAPAFADAPETAPYREFFEWAEPAATIPPDRLLTILHGESEGVLEVTIRLDESDAVRRLRRRFVSGRAPCAEHVAAAVQDAVSRILAPRIATDLRSELKTRADDDAIRRIAQDVRNLLLTPPLGPRRVLAVHPGHNPGCSIAVIDRDGALLDHAVLPIAGGSNNDAARSRSELRRLARTHSVEAVALGEGAARDEIREAIASAGLPPELPVFEVSSAGASRYAASDAARSELPECDAGIRCAVTIGRRLQDPLIELARLDARTLVTGPHRRDVDPQRLHAAVDECVRSCVCEVGVDLNSAPAGLLACVAGLTESNARSIVEHREQNGPFRSRSELLQVPGIGEIQFGIAAGFLRIARARHPLDSTGVHPEHYHIVERMARDLDCRVRDLLRNGQLRSRITPRQYVESGVGPLAIKAILAELASPGRNLRTRSESTADSTPARSPAAPTTAATPPDSATRTAPVHPGRPRTLTTRRNPLQQRYGAKPEPEPAPSGPTSAPAEAEQMGRDPGADPIDERIRKVGRQPRPLPTYSSALGDARVVDRLSEWKQAAGVPVEEPAVADHAEEACDAEHPSARECDIPSGDARVTDRLEEWRRLRLASDDAESARDPQPGKDSSLATNRSQDRRSWLSKALRRAGILS